MFSIQKLHLIVAGSVRSADMLTVANAIRAKPDSSRPMHQQHQTQCRSAVTKAMPRRIRRGNLTYSLAASDTVQLCCAAFPRASGLFSACRVLQLINNL